MLLDASTTCGRFCPERNKSTPEAEEVGDWRKCQCVIFMTIYKISYEHGKLTRCFRFSKGKNVRGFVLPASRKP